MEKKSFYRSVMILVLPMALQNVINVGINATDVIMLGNVSETALSGCSLAGQISFILNLFLFGMASGASVLTAQYWGKKDKDSIEKILGMAMGVCIFFGFLFCIISLLFPYGIMSLFTNDEEVRQQGILYLRIVAFAYPLQAFSMSYLNLIRSVEKVVISTVVYGTSLILNFGLNYILIFGKLGFAPLGIRGAAIGTLSARAAELCMVLIYSGFFYKEIRVRFQNLVPRSRVLFKDFLHYSGPVVLNEVLWGVGYSANAAIVGHLGSSAISANSVAQVCRQLSMVLVFGVASAAAIMIGKTIGENKPQLAKEYSIRFTKLAFAGGIGGGLLILIITFFINDVMNFSGTTAQYTKIFLYMMSYYVVCQAVNTTWIVGIFRSGGDTLFGMIVDMLTLWCGSILLSALAAFVFHWPIVIVYFILLGDELFKIPFCLIHFKKMKWLNHVTR